jgi:hypothetical protein
MVARILLLYNGGTGSPRLRQRGCEVLVGTATHERGRRDLNGGPLRRATRASVMAGGVLHPRQAVAYTRGKSTMETLDLGLAGLDLGM